ncbi:platelet-derived growth factor receptor beta-like isoform X1 [Corythoichthys intestinalis]|uniref:platelet-derived growth factor receptor beta-like isoform X1 n=1 Tax=Corythoichthys intestinalis TaxID=161448 RepID=UPI0025A67053|nr:platelet-derived growth factor receptor beta-like isoform X1 [Corythoichthys intestinalis]
MSCVTLFALRLTVTVLLCLYGNVSCLEVTPHDGELVLAAGSSLTLNCSGSGNTTWEFKRKDVPNFQVELGLHGVQSYQIVQNGANSSTLSLWNVSWKHTGVYLCTDQHTGERKEVNVFVPDPDVWFVVRAHGMITKTSELTTIPCVVTNPKISVSLYEEDIDLPVKGHYIPSEGYTATLEDRTYFCRGEMNGEVKESQDFVVFSVFVSESMDVYINSSKTVLKQGEPLTVNCTVHGAELVYFSWDIPNKEGADVALRTEFVSPTSMRSCLIFPHATLAHSGKYVCHVQEVVLDQTASSSVNITVLERGFVKIQPAEDSHVSARLQQDAVLRVKVEAYPAPQVSWSKGGAAIKGNTIIVFRKEHGTRYVSILRLVRVRRQQKGHYTARVTNGDDTKEVTFDLEVQVPSQIKSLTELRLPGKRHLVTCVAEGVPTPTIQWYSCDSMLKCNTETTIWQPLVTEADLLSIQTNITYSESRKTSQVWSWLTFHKPQHANVRCESNNQLAMVGRRDVKVVSSSFLLVNCSSNGAHILQWRTVNHTTCDEPIYTPSFSQNVLISRNSCGAAIIVLMIGVVIFYTLKKTENKAHKAVKRYREFIYENVPRGVHATKKRKKMAKEHHFSMS